VGLALLVSLLTFGVPDVGAAFSDPLFVAVPSAAFDSVDFSPALVASFVSDGVVADTPFLLSVLYQPEPLKIIPTG
jgi:hypothetical protein